MNRAVNIYIPYDWNISVESDVKENKEKLFAIYICYYWNINSKSDIS